MYREIVLWQSLDHPHILPFLGVDGVNSDPLICMVSPWMHYGNLLDYIKLCHIGLADVHGLVRGTLRIPLWMTYYSVWLFVYPKLLQAVKGVEYLHSQSVVHGDIRCASRFSLILISYAQEEASISLIF
jgi:serine/threonine protein kinase